MAAVPVALLWFIFLHVVPQQFKDFAVHYIEEHPEEEAKALEEARVRTQDMRQAQQSNQNN